MQSFLAVLFEPFSHCQPKIETNGMFTMRDAVTTTSGTHKQTTTKQKNCTRHCARQHFAMMTDFSRKERRMNRSLKTKPHCKYMASHFN